MIFSNKIGRQDKKTPSGYDEGVLQNKACVIWMTGLSGSGKSTLAYALSNELATDGRANCVLDGDVIRKGLSKDLGFRKNDRIENNRRCSEVAKLLVQSGVTAIVSFISPYGQCREYARGVIGVHDFIEVFMSTPIEVCEARDVKGLYGKARNGELPGFTGIDSPYEKPVDPEIVIDTTELSIDKCVENIMSYLSLSAAH